MDTTKDITETLKDLMNTKDIGQARLASLTDVPARFIEALLQGDFDRLPPRPYVRGYLFKVSSVLGVESEDLWQIYRASVDGYASGERDRLPTNRYAIKKMSPKVIAGGLGVLVLVLLIIFNFNRILGRPTLELNLPESTQEQVITVTGRVAANDRLTLNDELIYTDESGRFEKQVQLEPGLNTLEFKARHYLGRETSVIRQVFYQPTAQAPENASEETPIGEN